MIAHSYFNHEPIMHDSPIITHFHKIQKQNTSNHQKQCITKHYQVKSSPGNKILTPKTNK